MTRFALLVLLTACSQPETNALSNAASGQAGEFRAVDLPDGLREVSGLAVASPNSVFAHDDEHARISEIDLASGRALRSFAFGAADATGDFEGIAAAGSRIHVITSDGQLSSFDAGADGAVVPAEVHDTGIGARCEIEGLSLSPHPGDLLILCKDIPGRGNGGRLLVFSWNIATNRLQPQPWIDVDLSAELGPDRRGFAPSSIDWDARTRRVAIVSARNRVMMLLDDYRRVVELRRLDAGRHPQAEGVAIMPSGDIVVADEGGDGRPGRLTIYPR